MSIGYDVLWHPKLAIVASVLFKSASLTHDNYWRAIILYGRKVASYKFALAQSLLELASNPSDLITLEQLAEPFSRHICNHLQLADKQATSTSSRFLDVCRSFNAGEVSKDVLVDATVRLGFENVIDAFHIVNQDEVGVRFFTDERVASKGILLTDELRKLLEDYQGRNLPHEVEARWRLVETAWALSLPRQALTVTHDDETGLLLADPRRYGRKAITSSRSALNGYQKGKCFYCFRDISVVEAAEDLADVEHVFPHSLKAYGVAEPVDGVWNLVLACKSCNRGPRGKFDRLPALRYLERLHTRNESLIASHHPLRETLMQQTGLTVEQRQAFLQQAYTQAQMLLIHTWSPEHEFEAAF